jgi:periplasmic protein TonB
MAYVRSSPKERLRGGLGAAALTALAGWALLAGLGVSAWHAPDPALQLFQVLPDPPPPERKHADPPRQRSRRPEGEASPPNLRAEPTEIVAPVPVVPLVVPPPVVSAPIAGTGAAPSAGSADVPGPGYGAGGEGDGRGAGGSGDGDGGGGDDETPPRQIGGRIRNSDYPREAGDAGAGGTVEVAYLVWTDGRVRDCRITRSSGNAALDATTCRLIRERFRFKPSRDARGRPVPATVIQNHEWVVERVAPDPEDDRR